MSEFPDIVHGIFTRNGGTGTGPFHSLNVGFRVGDKKENVLKNRQIVSNIFGGMDLICVRQVHGTHGVIIKEKEAYAGIHVETPPVGDALVTGRRNLLLVIQVADCQPVMVYDPEKHMTVNIHCGWRGNVENIIGRTIGVMRNTFNCDPERLIAGIGPSLGPCCAEFVNYKQEIPEIYWKHKIGENHFDLWAISRDQLCNAGVLPKNIELSNICTQCNTDQFFSYRAEEETGRFAAVIGLV